MSLMKSPLRSAPIESLLWMLLPVLLLAVASGEMSSDDTRPPPVEKFSVARFAGGWFFRATRGIPTSIDCRYDLLFNVSQWNILGFIQAARTNSNQTIKGYGSAKTIKPGVGRLNLTMTLMPGWHIFDIIYLDYDHLAIFLSCPRPKMGYGFHPKGQAKNMIIFVITRDRNLNSAVYEKKLKELGLDPHSLTKMNQKNCPAPF